MFIVIDGENKCGKTSLAKKLHEMTGWEIVKFNQPEGEPYIEYMNFLLTRKEPAIIDRFYLGEHAYGPVYRGKDGLEEWQNRMIEMTLMARMSLNIYCETDEDTIISNFKKEKEEFAKEEQIHAVLHNFRRAIKNSKLVWNTFDYQRDSKYKEVSKLVIDWLSKYKQNEFYIKSLVGTRAIGNPFASNIIVGDICNGDVEILKYRDIIMPFAKGVSSNYLWKALEGISNSKYLLTNSRKYHYNGHIDMRDVFTPYVKKTICLGNNSYADVVESVKAMLLPIKIVKMKHPAWGSRFNIDPEMYAEGIKNELI